MLSVYNSHSLMWNCGDGWCPPGWAEMGFSFCPRADLYCGPPSCQCQVSSLVVYVAEHLCDNCSFGWLQWRVCHVRSDHRTV